MAQGVNEAVNGEMVQALAEANGISIPDDRLDIVLSQYRTYLELLSQLDTFLLSREAEPAVKFELSTTGTAQSPGGRR